MQVVADTPGEKVFTGHYSQLAAAIVSLLAINLFPGSQVMQIFGSPEHMHPGGHYAEQIAMRLKTMQIDRNLFIFLVKFCAC